MNPITAGIGEYAAYYRYIGVCCGSYVATNLEEWDKDAGITVLVSTSGKTLPYNDHYKYFCIQIPDGRFIHIKEMHEPIEGEHQKSFTRYGEDYNEPALESTGLYSEKLWGLDVHNIKGRKPGIYFHIYTEHEEFKYEKHVKPFMTILYQSEEWVWNQNYVAEGHDDSHPRLKLVISELK
jgi:hypothetical protein